MVIFGKIWGGTPEEGRKNQQVATCCFYFFLTNFRNLGEGNVSPVPPLFYDTACVLCPGHIGVPCLCVLGHKDTLLKEQSHFSHTIKIFCVRNKNSNAKIYSDKLTFFKNKKNLLFFSNFSTIAFYIVFF